MPPSSPLSPEPHDFAVSGDVTLAPSAAIAPGVLLHADPDSQIVIGAGVCIGIGAILHAHEGLLDIQVGTTIGAGVLIIGSGEIGVNACIGSGSTLINPAIKAEQVVATGSLIGDNSRQLNEEIPSEAPPQPEATETTETTSLPHSVDPVVSALETAPPSPPPESADESVAIQFPQPIIYGRANLDQLLDRLLPHRKTYNNSNQNSQPKPGEISKIGKEQTQ